MTKIKKDCVIAKEKDLFDKAPTILPKSNFIQNEWGKVHQKQIGRAHV